MTAVPSKGIPLCKDDVTLLINLVEVNKVIMSRATNASNNKLKELAWCKIAEKFNASCKTYPRKVGQLRLKWENLKKTARKKAKNRIEFNKEYSSTDHNNILDRVISMLAKTNEEDYSITVGDGTYKLYGSINANDISNRCNNVFVDVGNGSNSSNSSSGDSIVEDFIKEQEIKESPYNMPETEPFNNGKSYMQAKRKLIMEDIEARIARNKAIAEYYIAKKKKLDLTIENMEVNNRHIKIELEN